MKKLEEVSQTRNKKINKVEKMKALRTPQEAYEKLEYYAKNGYDSIPDEDKKFFLKCFGLFDKGKLTPRQFMLRVRVPGGHLNAHQAEAIGSAAKKYGQDYIDITTRAQIELRYLDIENIPKIFAKLKSVGIDSYQTGVDNFRNIVNDPLDKYAYDNILPSQETLEKIQSIFLHDPEWIGALPRKFNTAISGSISNRCNVYGHDCSFVLAQKDGAYGYNMYLGGKNGQVAKSANIFLKNETEVFKAYGSLIDLFKRFGFRDNRNKNRLYFLIQNVGMEELSSAIKENAGIDFATAGESLTTLDSNDADHGKVQLRDGSFALHVIVPSGMFSGTALMEAARIAKTDGNSELRFSIEQNLYILGVKEVEKVLAEPFFQEYKNINTPYFNNLIACAGTKHCAFGVIENKEDAKNMANYLSQRVPLENARIRFHWSACVKGCGLHGFGDIGFEGCKAKLDGQTVDGVHITIGGKLVSEGVEGYSVIKSAPLIYAPQYVETLMLEYKNLRGEKESFAKFHDRVLQNYTSAYIGFYMQLKAYLRSKEIDLDLAINKVQRTGKNEEFEIFELGRKLYYQFFKAEAYSAYDRFNNENPRDRLQDLSKQNFDTNMMQLIEAMIGNTTRAKVFSEISHFVALNN